MLHRLAAVVAGTLPAALSTPDDAERIKGVLARPERLDHETLDYFRRSLSKQYSADRALGPQQLLKPLLAQLEALDDMRRHCRPGTTTPLLQLLAQFAEFAGWLHQDLGNIDAAMRWSDRAIALSQTVGDYDMVAYLLVRKSNIACLDGDGVLAVELATAARRVPAALSPRLIALASQQEARGWAMLGELANVIPKLDLAASLLLDRSADLDPNAPIYLHQYNLDALEEQSASCYRSAGRAEEAVAILSRKLTNTPEHLLRDRGHVMAKLGNAIIVARHPDPEQAADLGIRSAAIARRTGSARILKEVRTLDRALTARWPGLSHTAALHDCLALG